MLAENAKRIPDVEHTPGNKGTELSKTPVELKGGDWMLKVVPWIGGRIIAMEHHPSGMICSRCKQSTTSISAKQSGNINPSDGHKASIGGF